LRWWNEVKDDGNEEWIFESDHEIRKTSIDTSIFWFSLYITPIFWGVFLIIEFIGIKWMWVNYFIFSLNFFIIFIGDCLYDFFDFVGFEYGWILQMLWRTKEKIEWLYLYKRCRANSKFDDGWNGF